MQDADAARSHEMVFRMSSLRINSARMLREIDRFAAINRREDGSCCRLALTDADRQVRDMLVAEMRQLGLRIEVDPIGNIVGVMAGATTHAPVMTGSHLDTVATGGRYDGLYGVIAGLEVLRTLQENNVQPQRPVALAMFTNEEGVRFQPDMMGSLVFAGGLLLNEALAATAEDGVSLGDELTRIGYAGSTPSAQLHPGSFVELHIEQGPVLDRAGEVLGAVADLQGISWREIEILGVSNHAGTTPLSLRHDAGYAAAKIAVFVRDLAVRMGGSQVATMGRIQLSPNLVNVIPRRAVLTIDLRNTDERVLVGAEKELDAFVAELSRSEGVEIRSRQLVRTQPVQFDEEMVALVQRVAAELGHPARRMTSGAGHDAQMIARLCPTAMIFVPSIGGISHNARETTAEDHLAIGADALLQVILRLAG